MGRIVTPEIEKNELTEEGKKMWETIADYEKLLANISVLPAERRKKLRLNMFEIELIFIRTELRKMIVNSEKVIKECTDIIEKVETQEDYIKCDAKVAKLIHTNLIIRLTRILESMPAFDHKIDVDDDEAERPYSRKGR